MSNDISGCAPAPASAGATAPEATSVAQTRAGQAQEQIIAMHSNNIGCGVLFAMFLSMSALLGARLVRAGEALPVACGIEVFAQASSPT
ncbi:hypothetical protein [Pandoraea pnomenusa]|uniref:hypothetical protein n=1 Tax=Pandoraea pnomenusa TaxID=93220 RepID=UPI00333EFB4F